MARREISQNAWRSELDAFSRQHDGWIVTVRVVGHGGDTHVAAHDVPLHGISPLASDGRDLVVTLGTGDRHLAHRIPNPTALAIDETPHGASRGLIVEAADGTTTIEFRAPMRPEEVDGLPRGLA